MQLGPEHFVGEHGLHEVLAVVERSLDGDVVDVRFVDGGHLPALHVTHPSRGVKHHDVEVAATDARRDRRRTGVARGGHHDRSPFATAGELVVHQPADELERDVLERQGRAVPELLHPQVVVELDNRAHVVVIEGRVCVGHRFAVDAGDGGRHIDIRIGQVAGQLRQRVGDIEAAVTRQPFEHRVLEPELGGAPACADVLGHRLDITR